MQRDFGHALKFGAGDTRFLTESTHGNWIDDRRRT